MEGPGRSHRGASTQAATGTSSLEPHDHTRLWLQSKLSGDWSAQAGASGLTEERLNALSRCFGTLDSMVKVRLLLAGLFLPGRERSRLQPQLLELSSQAASNQDEWVRATAAVVGDFSGPMDMRSLMAQFPLVRESVLRFSSHLSEVQTPTSLLPQTEQYMHGDISRLPAVGSSGAAAASTSTASTSPPSARPHFRLREAPHGSLADLGQGLAGGPGGLAGAAGGALMLPGAGAGASSLAAAASLGLDSKGSLGSGAGSESLVRRSLSQVGGGGGPSETSSILRSRADVFHGKELKQGPPTPSGKGTPPLAPGLPLRLSRSRSLVSPDQQPPISESPSLGAPAGGGGAIAAAAICAGGSLPFSAAAAFNAAAGTATPPPGTTAFTAAHVGPSATIPAHSAIAGGPAAAAAATTTLPPLPPQQPQSHAVHSDRAAGPAAAVAAASGPPPPSSTRPTSLQGGSVSSYSAGAAPTQQQYPLAEAIIAFAAAAASGEPPATFGPLTIAANTAAGQLPSHVPASYAQHQHQKHLRGAQADHLVKRGYSHEREAGVGEYNEGAGRRYGDLEGRPSPGAVERMQLGRGLPRQWSASESGAGGIGWRAEEASDAAGVGGSMEVMGRVELVQEDDDEWDAKTPRPGQW
ncbi:hypothetical protein VaNZ11_006933 [Volvox africanus]|uniref:NELF-A N-terminal domain-containing protein n=1 Tax=Volvox africanus TaxID=51714 RepID=A0ABQ5S3J4_9CHLO|nr:hypothetical protein VaNZ11_006933 [Volvox africanus]